MEDKKKTAKRKPKRTTNPIATGVHSFFASGISSFQPSVGTSVALIIKKERKISKRGAGAKRKTY